MKREIVCAIESHLLDPKKSTTHSPSLRYVQAVFILLNKEKQDLVKQFLVNYIFLLNHKSFPLFTTETALLTFEKWKMHPTIFEDLHYLSKKVKDKSLPADFWNLFIRCSATDKPNSDLQRARLNLLATLMNSKTIKKEEFLTNGSIIATIMKLKIHTDDYADLKKQLKTNPTNAYFRMFFVLRQSLNRQLKGLELSELLMVHFSTPDRGFKYSENVKDFYLKLQDCLPDAYHLQFRKMDLGKLFHIYQLCPRLFENVEIDHQAQLNLEVFVQQLFKDFMFSGVFLKAFCADQISSTEMIWFIDELSGKNLIYSEALPFKITKKTAHHFRCLPFSLELSVTRSLIYSSLCTAETDEGFAMVVARSIRSLEHANYWVETMSQLHKNGLRSINVREVLDYLQEKVFVEGEQINLKNKSVRNLLAEIDHWHEQLRVSRILKRVGAKKLVESEIETYFTDLDGESFVIKQIKRTNELYYEGEYLHHCVYTYRRYCLDGSTFIFSLRKIDENADELPLITIEVVSNQIRQIKGKFNRQPLEFEKEIIRTWALEKQLKIAC